jgi:hypothetical protein
MVINGFCCMWRTILVVGPADAGLSLLSSVTAVRPGLGR